MRIDVGLYEGVEDAMNAEQYNHKKSHRRHTIEEIEWYLCQAKNSDYQRAANAVGNAPANRRKNDIWDRPRHVSDTNHHHRGSQVIVHPDGHEGQVKSQVEVVAKSQDVRAYKWQCEQCA